MWQWTFVTTHFDNALHIDSTSLQNIPMQQQDDDDDDDDDNNNDEPVPVPTPSPTGRNIAWVEKNLVSRAN